MTFSVAILLFEVTSNSFFVISYTNMSDARTIKVGEIISPLRNQTYNYVW